MKKVLITGAKGIIGQVLTEGLRNYHITPVDLPEKDVRDYDALYRLAAGKDTIVHLAWNTKTDNIGSGRIDINNSLMFENVYRVALARKQRVIVASSVHVDTFSELQKSEMLSPDRDPTPDSPYGAHKIFLEKLGLWYACKGLEVICIRFGGVYRLNQKPQNDMSVVGLSHPDCVNLITKCIEAKSVPNNFVIVYGVSDNKNRIHNLTNPFGWKPKLNAVEFYRITDRKL